MTPFQILAVSFLFVSPILILDAYGFKKEAEQAAYYLAAFLFGFGCGGWLL